MRSLALLAALVTQTGASHAEDQACDRYTNMPAFGVLALANGGMESYLHSNELQADEALSLRLKAQLQRHVAGRHDDASVVLRGAALLPPLVCARATVHRLRVRRVELTNAPAEANPAADPVRAIAELELARRGRGLSRAETEQLRQLYWSTGDVAKATALAQTLFGAP